MSSQATEVISQAIAEALAQESWEELEAACNVHAERQQLTAFLTSSLKPEKRAHEPVSVAAMESDPVSTREPSD